MKVVFISGPYRGNVEHNIIEARKAAAKLWASGYVVICPHLNTANFDYLYPEIPDSVWLEGDLEILRRCDAIYMLKGYISSQGAQAELKLALKTGKEIIFQE
jgi:hypothetical protein